MLQRLRRLGTTPGQSILHPVKLRAIDAAFQGHRTDSFADLGGVWAVDAGYTFYALERYGSERAVVIDEEFTPSVRARAEDHPALTLLPLNFGSDEAVSALGRVDATLLFDVLLHQVAPDWDDVLRKYAQVSDRLIIVNPQYVAGEETVRLLELGPGRYHEIVPAQPGYEDLFERLDEYLPDRGRHYRDIHNVWQWGIVDADLKRVLSELGFELVYFENAGQWRQQPAFENHAFVFVKRRREDSARPA